MKKILFVLLAFLFCSPAYAVQTWYACSGGGNWNGASVWTSIIGDEVGCTGATGNPVAGDTAVLNSSSGNITITANAAAATLTMTGYTGTLAFGTSHSLTLTAGATLQGAFSAAGTSDIVVQGGGVTLAATPTGSTFPILDFTTTGQTLTSGGFQWPGPVTFGVVGTFTFNGNWYTGGNTLLASAPVLNKTTTETYTAAGGLSGNIAVTGSIAQLYLEGGTWTTGGSQVIQVPMTITPVVSNITLSGIVNFGGTNNTLTYTPSTFTVTTTGSTLELGSITGSITLAISGLTLNNLYISQNVTYNFPTTLNLTGNFSGFNVSAGVVDGATTINCANLNFLSTAAAAGSMTFQAGTTINVSNSILLSGALLNTGGNSPEIIKSDTASSPIFINYSGTAANAVVSNTSFTDVQFTGLPVYNYSQSSNLPTLTRTTGVTLVTPANINTSYRFAYP